MKKIAIISLLCLSLSFQGYAAQPFFEQAQSTAKKLWASKGFKIALGIGLVLLTATTATVLVVKSRKAQQKPPLPAGNQEQPFPLEKTQAPQPIQPPQSAEPTATPSKEKPKKAIDILLEEEEGQTYPPYKPVISTMSPSKFNTKEIQLQHFQETIDAYPNEGLKIKLKQLNYTPGLQNIYRSKEGQTMIKARLKKAEDEAKKKEVQEQKTPPSE